HRMGVPPQHELWLALTTQGANMLLTRDFIPAQTEAGTPESNMLLAHRAYRDDVYRQAEGRTQDDHAGQGDQDEDEADGRRTPEQRLPRRPGFPRHRLAERPLDETPGQPAQHTGSHKQQDLLPGAERIDQVVSGKHEKRPVPQVK